MSRRPSLTCAPHDVTARRAAWCAPTPPPNSAAAPTWSSTTPAREPPRRTAALPFASFAPAFEPSASERHRFRRTATNRRHAGRTRRRATRRGTTQGFPRREETTRTRKNERFAALVERSADPPHPPAAGARSADPSPAPAATPRRRRHPPAGVIRRRRLEAFASRRAPRVSRFRGGARLSPRVSRRRRDARRAARAPRGGVGGPDARERRGRLRVEGGSPVASTRRGSSSRGDGAGRVDELAHVVGGGGDADASIETLRREDGAATPTPFDDVRDGGRERPDLETAIETRRAIAAAYDGARPATRATALWELCEMRFAAGRDLGDVVDAAAEANPESFPFRGPKALSADATARGTCSRTTS